MKKLGSLVLLAISLIMIAVSPIYAGEVEILINKLVEKRVLTPVEAQIILDETKKQVSEELAQQKSYAVPSWAQKIKFKGDIRLRHQYERRENDTEGRNRGRVRYRLAMEAAIAETLKAGAGLASGSSDPRSTNQTLQNTFDTPDIRLDLAYIEYSPMSNVDIVAGKFKRKNYLWAPTDLLWDGDINPEGASAHAEYSLTNAVDSFFNTGIWILDDNDQVDRPDPYLTYVQGGLTYKDDKFDGKAAVIHYGFQSVQGLALDNDSGTNTAEGGVLKYDYDSVGVSLEAGVRKLFGGLPLKIDDRIAVFYDFIHNVDAEENENGWAIGTKFGHKKIKGKGQWQAKYIYADLKQDAFIDAFPDSDRYGGATGVKSHEAALNYGLMKNVTLGLDYYYSKRTSTTENPEHLMQADMLVKF